MDYLPPRNGSRNLIVEVVRTLGLYVSGQARISFIVACCYAAGFAFFRVPWWPLIGALGGVLNPLPIFGAPLALVIALVAAWAGGADAWRLLGVLSVFVVVQTFEGYFLTPRILGRRLGLRPLYVFLSVMVGGFLFGFVGLLLAIPILAVAMTVLRFLERRQPR